MMGYNRTTQTMVALTDREIMAEVMGVRDEDLPGFIEGDEDDQGFEAAEGWDGEELSIEEIAHRNLYGDDQGNTLTDRPLQLAEEQDYEARLAQNEQQMAEMQEYIQQLETSNDPDRQARAAVAREEAAYQLISNPDQALNHMGALTQEVEQLRMNRADASLRAAHRDHGEDFEQAYQAITSLDPRSPVNQAIVSSFLHSNDPGQALMEWYGAVGGNAGRLPPFMAGRRGVAPPPIPSRRGPVPRRAPVDLADEDGGFGREDVESDIWNSAMEGV